MNHNYGMHDRMSAARGGDAVLYAQYRATMNDSLESRRRGGAQCYPLPRYAV